MIETCRVCEKPALCNSRHLESCLHRRRVALIDMLLNTDRAYPDNIIDKHLSELLDPVYSYTKKNFGISGRYYAVSCSSDSSDSSDSDDSIDSSDSDDSIDSSDSDLTVSSEKSESGDLTDSDTDANYTFADDSSDDDMVDEQNIDKSCSKDDDIDDLPPLV